MNETIERGHMIMYKDRLAANLETSRKAEKKSSILYTVLCLVIFLFMGFGAYGCFSGLLEAPEWFPYSTVSMGIGCAGVSLLGLAGTVFFFLMLKRNMSSSANDVRMQQILENVRKIGPEGEVFEKLEKMEPRTVGSWEVRFDEELCAGLSEKDPDNNFIHPMSEMIRAGITGDGKKRKPKYTLYIHRQQSGKTVKCSAEGDYDSIRDLLDALEKANPKMELAKYPG